MIPHSRPSLGTDEIDAAVAVLQSGQIAQGPEVERLEESLSRLLSTPGRSRHTVMVSSGTAALWLALRSLGVGEGDEVLIPAYTCSSLRQAVRAADARPRFLDCDPDTLNPDPGAARRALGPRTAACIVSHQFGRPAPIEEFRELDVPLIEDCAQTLGVSGGGRNVGCDGPATVCSFYATKLIAGGEGGAVVFDDSAAADVARRLRDCEADEALDDAFNFKASDIHAALARVQLERLDEFLARRRQMAAAYTRELEGLPLRAPAEPDDGEHAWFRYVVLLDRIELDELVAASERLGLACRRPVGRLASEVADRIDELPGCRAAWRSACSIPLYPALTDDEAVEVTRRFRAALEACDG